MIVVYCSTCGLRIFIRYRLYGYAVRIPLLPQDTKQKGIEKSIPFVFYAYGANSFADEGIKNKRYGLPLFAQCGL